jgi:hypothetical protein
MSNGICAACSTGHCEHCPGTVVKQFRESPSKAVYEAVSACEHGCHRPGETREERRVRLKSSPALI